ncbi:MAG: sulfatase [Kofleriaceae bacterium]
MSPVRTWLAEPIAAGVVAGAALGLLEVVGLGALGRPALAVTALAVAVVAGGLVGLVVDGAQALARVAPRRLAPLVAAAPSLVVSIPVGGALFQGAFAATLPGARWAPVAVPVVATLALALVIAVGARLAARGPSWRRAVAGALALVALAATLANRGLFRSGYPTLHLALTLTALAALAVGLHGALAGPRGPRRVTWLTAGAVAAVAIAAAVWGLAGAADRAVVAARGDQLRHLARAARALIDLDRDGSSAILGGGDCDDLDAARHVGASDRPGNGLDEDCDGVDAPLPPAVVEDRAQQASLASWRASPEVAALRRRLASANLVLISVDALRADRVAADEPTTPRLAGFLAEAAHFTRALAPAAGTDVSLTTFVTGRWNPFQAIAATLAEALTRAGLVTHAIFPREVLRYAGETLLTRGWATVDRVVTDGGRRDVGDRVSAADTTDDALAFLDRVGAQRFAVWAHYFDVHEHAQLPVPPALAARVTTASNPVDRRYRALLAGVDAEIGRLLDGLAARGHADDTVVVLFSDHGESLGDDPRLPDHHGLVVYQALTHVPVAIRVPGGAARILDQPMSLVDLAPTVLGLLGLTGMAPLDGVDLADDVLGAPAALIARDRTLVMHEQDQWAVVAWPYKLLVRPADNLTELYDLAVDPGERDDLARREPLKVSELRGRFGWFPPVSMDRSQAGRRWRERQAQPPPHRSQP